MNKEKLLAYLKEEKRLTEYVHIPFFMEDTPAAHYLRTTFSAQGITISILLTKLIRGEFD